MPKPVTASARTPEPVPADELLAKFMRGLGDPTRLRIVRYLLAGPRTVSCLADAFLQLSNELRNWVRP